MADDKADLQAYKDKHWAPVPCPWGSDQWISLHGPIIPVECPVCHLLFTHEKVRFPDTNTCSYICDYVFGTRRIAMTALDAALGATDVTN